VAVRRPPGPTGFGTGSGSVSAVVVASASMREGPFSLARFLFGTLLGHCRRRALKSLRYFVQYIAASWDARRLARRLACRVMCTPNGCRCTRTFLGAPPTPRFGVSEAKFKPRAQKMRRGNE